MKMHLRWSILWLILSAVAFTVSLFDGSQWALLSLIALTQARIEELSARLTNATSVIHGDPHCQWSLNDTFICDRCKRVCCYCAGGDDDELCDDCSVERGDVDP